MANRLDRPLPFPCERAGQWRLAGHPERLGAWLGAQALGMWAPHVAQRVIGRFAGPAAAVQAGTAAWKLAAPNVELFPQGGSAPSAPPAAHTLEMPAGARAVSLFDDGYPERLHDLLRLHASVGPPALLQVRGNLPASPCVAIVGARRADEYGRRTARRLAADLAGQGVCVVSGLARGVDGAAHRGALEAGGLTVAVLGSGLGHVYPPEHAGLADEIAQQGAVVSEFPAPWSPPGRYAFPLRNRIIAALAQVVVVVQAGDRSGALLTADHAETLDRDVAAVPGDVDRNLSLGTNRLLAEGAHVVRDAGDVLALLSAGGLFFPPSTSGRSQGRAERLPPGLDPVARRMLALLGTRPAGADDLAARLGLDAAAALAALGQLEWAGLAARGAGGYTRAAETVP